MTENLSIHLCFCQFGYMWEYPESKLTIIKKLSCFEIGLSNVLPILVKWFKILLFTE